MKLTPPYESGPSVTTTVATTRRQPTDQPAPPVALSLATAEPLQGFVVSAVVAPPGAPEWAGQLEDLGFIAGEQVSLMARSKPDTDPLVVRIGLSTFALRRVEAACIHVTPAPS